MSRNRRNKHNNKNRNNANNSSFSENSQNSAKGNRSNKNHEKDFGFLNDKPKFQFNRHNYENEEERLENQKAIQELKSKNVVCPMCGQIISDVASSLSDKISGEPVHFDCAIQKVRENENLNEGEKISYIGQGRFAVIHFENPKDQKKFSIKKIIEWENKDSHSQWREEYSSLFSQIH